jgi:hypothetical protein
MPSDWCGRSVLYSWRQASSAACSASMLSNGPWTSSSSRCKVWCSRSIFPVVAGEWIFVSRWAIPFSRQTRSNSTSTGTPGLWNRPVNTFPLPVILSAVAVFGSTRVAIGLRCWEADPFHKFRNKRQRGGRSPTAQAAGPLADRWRLSRHKN